MRGNILGALVVLVLLGASATADAGVGLSIRLGVTNGHFASFRSPVVVRERFVVREPVVFRESVHLQQFRQPVVLRDSVGCYGGGAAIRGGVIYRR